MGKQSGLTLTYWDKKNRKVKISHMPVSDILKSPRNHLPFSPDVELVCVAVAPLELASVPDPVPLAPDPKTLNPELDPIFLDPGSLLPL